MAEHNLSNDNSQRDPVLYLEDFRKARRNSLIWLGITLAAVLGTTGDNNGGNITSFGVNLQFKQHVLISMAGCVAILMNLEFYQACRRLFLFSKVLSYNKPKIDESFGELDRAASAATAKLDAAKSRYDDLQGSTSGTFAKVIEQLGEMRDWETSMLSAPERSPIGEENEGDSRASIHAWQRAEIARLREWISRIRAEGLQGATSPHKLQDVRKEAYSAQKALQSLFDSFVKDEEELIGREVSTFKDKSSGLLKFHRRIYRRDIAWIWIIDIGPIAVLSFFAWFPFIRSVPASWYYLMSVICPS